MCLFTQAVAKGLGQQLLIADLPFLSFRMGLEPAVRAAGALMAAGAHAVKLEGFIGNLELITHLVNSGIPVMGHLGLTPQFVHSLGGYRVQGRDTTTAETILHGAHELEKAGCFSLVLECVPSSLAHTITKQIHIPTIGIGAGPDTDGQILVWQDLLGMNTDFQPKFVRRYMNGAEQITTALQNYVTDVRKNNFPNPTESYE
jgi:3-methyl-2-oxobutanoate hydroxymethyltransferase